MVVLMLGMNMWGQNPPAIGIPENDTLMVGSGQNFLLIPNVNDNDPGVKQDITFSLTSSDTDILEVTGVEYTSGSTLAIVHVLEKGNPGSVTLNIEASDPDGTATASFQIYVGPYSNPGINFEIHDVVFWQQEVPLDANPAFSMIASDGIAPYDKIDLPSLKLSVYSDCQESPPCTGVDFFTALFKGYVIPEVTGDYYFYMIAGDQCKIGLSSNFDFDNAEVILFSDADGRVGTSSGDYEWRSVQVSLEAGRTYALYGTQWNIHNLMGGIMWEGPGIEKAYIPGENLSYVYDVVKPGKVKDLTLEGTGMDDLRLSWSPSSDDRHLAGYNIYVNGILTNHLASGETSCQVEGLSPETSYCVMVTSVDGAGNESPESEVICAATYGSDDTPPVPPSLLEASIVSDMAVKLEWSGAVDNETEIRGYNIFVDGIRYNQASYIYGEEAILSGLNPETGYSITIEAVDAAHNVSEKSTPLALTTLAFDPYDTGISDKKARLNIENTAVGRSDGLAVNPDFVTGEYLDNPRHGELIRELEASGVRWGGLTPNVMNFKDYIGPGKAITYGRHMNFCNSINGYTIIVCGVENSTDWMTDPETFTNFLEYVAGPPDTEYGGIRASEGYTESLLDQSRGLVFEFGNEVWGGSDPVHNAQIGDNYIEYGKWCREMAVLMKASEYYDSTKIFLTYSGREPVPENSYGLHEYLLTGDSGEVDWLAVGGYLGGNLEYIPEIDPGESEGDYYKNGIFTMAENLEGLDRTMKLIAKKTGELKPTYMYEANMTDNSYYGRLGQAIVEIDYLASAVEKGGAIPTVFHLTGGQWKMTIPSQDFAKTPLFYTTQYYNKFCKGNVLKTTLETMATISNSTGEEMTFDPVGGHAYAEEGKFSVLLFSRDFEHDFTVQINLPDEIRLVAPETATMYVISGGHYSDREATVDSTVVSVSDNMLVEVPRYSMVIIAFEEEEQQVETLPLGYYDYITAASLSISPYGSDEYTITGRKTLVLRADMLPENVLWDGAVWEVETRGVNVEYGLKSYGFEIEGSKTCDGNGTITVRASAWDNPEIWDEVEVSISNQGTACGTGLEEGMYGKIKMYPNPAQNILHLEGIPEAAVQLEVTDITGRVCFTQTCSGTSARLDLTELEAGIYYLRIFGKDELVTRTFIHE